MNIENIMEKIELVLKRDHQTNLCDATPQELHNALGSVVMGAIAEQWYESRHTHERVREAYYFSAEYLTGRMVYNNLFSLGLLEQVREAFASRGLDLAVFEEIEDAALGNGGLGRLAACFLDSAATMNLPLDGYGLRYKYGLFKQSFSDGFQVESADDWQRGGDPWSRRRDTHEVLVHFADQTVRAVPYDMPVIGYGTNNIGTLRLWQSEAMEDFDFCSFLNSRGKICFPEEPISAVRFASVLKRMCNGAEVRATVLGYTQRGASPTSRDSTMAFEAGYQAVQLLKEKISNQAIGVKDGKIFYMPIEGALQQKRTFNQKMYKLVNTI